MTNTFFRFNTDQYFVEGTAKHAIYDLKKGYLYSVSEKAKKLIYHVHQHPYIKKQLNVTEQNILLSLIAKKILIKSNVPVAISDILKLKKPDHADFTWLEVTRKCNLSCKFCYERSNAHRRECMTLKDFRVAHQQLKKTGIKRIQFIGGEPLLLKSDLIRMVEECANDFLFIEIYTNGTLINKKWCDFFKKYHIHVALSIHSYLANEHDKIVQQKGAHRRVLKAIKLLKHENIPYRIACIRDKNCIVGKKPQNTEYTLFPECPKTVSKTMTNQFDFNMFQSKAITKETFKIKIDKQFIIKQVSGHQCFQNLFYIAYDLEVFPCVMERRKSYGNLKKCNLTAILNNKIRLLNKDNINECNGCEYRYACFDCRPDTNESGFYGKLWYCTYQPQTGQWVNLKMAFSKLKLT